MTMQYIHTELMIKDEAIFKRSRFVSRFPVLEIEVYEKQVFLAESPVSDDLTKFINGVAKHATKDSWIEINDVDNKKTMVYQFDGEGSFVVKDIDYDPSDEPEEFIPEDIEFVVTDTTETVDSVDDREKVNKPNDGKDDIFI